MKVVVLQSFKVGTSLSAATSYELNPADLPFERQLWVSRLLFFRDYLDWGRLRDALVKVERAYPPLCGGYVSDENGSRRIHVDPAEDNGFALVEIQVDATLAELRASRKMMSCCRESALYNMSWPYFLEQGSEDDVFGGQDFIFGVHLTRAKDGCILSFSQDHFISDGGRMAVLIADVGKAYRGLDIAAPQLDRSIMWPDQYLSHFSVPGHSPEMYPRRFVGREVPLTDGPTHVAQIHFKQEVIDSLKRETKDLLDGVDFVSANDLLMALWWLLRAEMIAKEPSSPSASPLPIEGTLIHFPVNVRTTCVPLVPEKYFGNALARARALYPLSGRAEASSIEKVAHAASSIRRAVNEIQTDSQSTLNALLMYYEAGCSNNSLGLENCICSSASRAKFALKDIDFGHRHFVFAPVTFPCLTGQSGTEPSPDGDGILMQVVVSDQDRMVLDSSSVLAECAPGAIVFPEDMKEEQVLALMAL